MSIQSEAALEAGLIATLKQMDGSPAKACGYA